jgi:uncharacterized protein YbbC (DUF1343 family)
MFLIVIIKILFLDIKKKKNPDKRNVGIPILLNLIFVSLSGAKLDIISECTKYKAVKNHYLTTYFIKNHNS